MLFVGVAALAVVALMAGRAASAAGRSAAAWDAVARNGTRTTSKMAPRGFLPPTFAGNKGVYYELADFEDGAGMYRNLNDPATNARLQAVAKTTGLDVRMAAAMRALERIARAGFPLRDSIALVLVARKLERDAAAALGVPSRVPAAQA